MRLIRSVESVISRLIREQVLTDARAYFGAEMRRIEEQTEQRMNESVTKFEQNCARLSRERDRGVLAAWAIGLRLDSVTEERDRALFSAREIESEMENSTEMLWTACEERVRAIEQLNLVAAERDKSVQAMLEAEGERDKAVEEAQMLREERDQAIELAQKSQEEFHQLMLEMQNERPPTLWGDLGILSKIPFSR